MTSMGRIALAPDRPGPPPARIGRLPAAQEIQVSIRPAASAVAALAEEWRALALAAAEPNAFAEHWFAAASLPTMTAHRDVKLIEIRRGGDLIGLLPLIVAVGYARLPVRHLRNWCHDQSFLGTPLVAAGEEEAFWDAVLDALDRASWAPSFLHLVGLVEGGRVHRALKRGTIVHREVRAFLESDLPPDAYYAQAVRQKKRKEIRRLQARLAEQGEVSTRTLADGFALDEWCDTYLILEKSGWKGKAGSALACRPETAAFFRDAVRGAWEAGRLQFLRLEVDGRTIAMLVNLLAPPGSFSFKTVFDEDYARFSPGVLIQVENLKILGHPAIAWMDSCAAADHPMIDSLWRQRRSIVRVTIRLKGARRLPLFALCRTLERGSAALKAMIG